MGGACAPGAPVAPPAPRCSVAPLLGQPGSPAHVFAVAQDGDSLPDAWADNVLTMDEIQANPSSNVILGQLARSVARMHGLADATVRARCHR